MPQQRSADGSNEGDCEETRDSTTSVTGTKKLGDESFRKERTMNDVMVQAVLWVGAAATLLLYLKRRRKRKMVP
jgi:hypothetical protein